MIANDRYPDVAAGSLLGGAIGDALGYAVEFISLKEIEKKFGPEGITAYEIDFEEGQAVVSDDTQMTLFTADGLMAYETKKAMGEPVGSAEDEIRKAYKYGWLPTQAYSPVPMPNASWLMDVPMLWARRAPGNTCLSALNMEEIGSVSRPLNQSKGCGGVMRVAPVALYDPDPEHILKLDMLGAEAAAITHGHPMGYIPAAALVHIVHRAAFGGCAYGDGL
ncbi:MAG: ADP-ribosylglycohydrolase family protein, partial [Clostridia bacterium]|nr:ADP-ribosylglycohydrolase family protein [Clostridia bacterium]